MERSVNTVAYVQLLALWCAVAGSKAESKESWIRAGMSALAEGGADRVKVEPLARSMGVTKGSFYWHFKDRRALLEAVLSAWESSSTLDVIDQVDLGDAPADARLEQLWSLTSGREGLALEQAIRDFARYDPLAKAVVARVDQARMDYLRRWFVELGFDRLEVEARSFAFYSLMIGNHFVNVRHGRYGRKRVLEQVRALLLNPPKPPQNGEES